MYETSNEGPVYNKKVNGGWKSSEMLRSFSHNDFSEFCLAHLFTFEEFTDNLVGVAYPASSRLDTPGGICTRGMYRIYLEGPINHIELIISFARLQ